GAAAGVLARARAAAGATRGGTNRSDDHECTNEANAHAAITLANGAPPANGRAKWADLPRHRLPGCCSARHGRYLIMRLKTFGVMSVGAAGLLVASVASAQEPAASGSAAGSASA